MKLSHRRFLHLVGLAAAVAVLSITLSGHVAWSQTARTIKVVVPFSPGGVVDFVARILAEHIGRAQGEAVLIENRAGAGGAIGAEAVSRAAPDGNTLLMAFPDLLIASHFGPTPDIECASQHARTCSSRGHNPQHLLLDHLIGPTALPG
jgi:tripartite-type tricarboxylate transporter receptor subunit TctC